MKGKSASVMKRSFRKVNLFRIACLATLLLTTLTRLAFAQQPQTPPPANPPGKPVVPSTAPQFKPDQVVLKIGNHEVTFDDLESILQSVAGSTQRQMRTQGRKSVVDDYVLMEVLSQQASSHHLDELPEYRRQMNMARLRWLAQAEYRNITNETKVTPEEISQYYSAHSPDFEEVELRQVTIRKRLPGAAASVLGLPGEEAMAKAEAVRKALEGGSDPKKVAEDFKMPNVVLIDIEPRKVRHGQLSRPQEEEVFKLKDGEFSSNRDDAQALYFMQVVKHNQPALKEVSKEIEAKLREQKITLSLENLKKAARIWMDPAYSGSLSAPPASTASTPPASPTQSSAAAQKP
jgi:hypothetical protein